MKYMLTESGITVYSDGKVKFFPSGSDDYKVIKSRIEDGKLDSCMGMVHPEREIIEGDCGEPLIIL